MEKALLHLIAEHKLPETFVNTVQQWYMPVASGIAEQAKNRNGPFVVGVQGCQGSGKSTLSDFLKCILETQFDLPTAVLSIDDFYLTHKEREQLAADKHPLLITRGVPGTHDVKLAADTIEELSRLKPGKAHKIPRFNKALDDREPEYQWDNCQGPVRIIVLEGWFVGLDAQEQGQLSSPVNTLEATEDADGFWRNFVNDALKHEYAELFARLDTLVVLNAPSFQCVFDWRLLQEQKLADKLTLESDDAKKGIMDEAQITRFISHYQRLTEHAIKTLPGKADWLLSLASDHSIQGLSSPNETYGR